MAARRFILSESVMFPTILMGGCGGGVGALCLCRRLVEWVKEALIQSTIGWSRPHLFSHATPPASSRQSTTAPPTLPPRTAGDWPVGASVGIVDELLLPCSTSRCPSMASWMEMLILRRILGLYTALTANLTRIKRVRLKMATPLQELRRKI